MSTHPPHATCTPHSEVPLPLSRARLPPLFRLRWYPLSPPHLAPRPLPVKCQGAELCGRRSFPLFLLFGYQGDPGSLRGGRVPVFLFSGLSTDCCRAGVEFLWCRFPYCFGSFVLAVPESVLLSPSSFRSACASVLCFFFPASDRICSFFSFLSATCDVFLGLVCRLKNGSSLFSSL